MSTMVIFKGRRVQGGIVSYIRGALQAGRISLLHDLLASLFIGQRYKHVTAECEAFIRRAEDMLSKKTQKRYFEMRREKNL